MSPGCLPAGRRSRGARAGGPVPGPLDGRGTGVSVVRRGPRGSPRPPGAALAACPVPVPRSPVRSESTSAATCRRSSGVSSSMLAISSSRSWSSGPGCPAGVCRRSSASRWTRAAAARTTETGTSRPLASASMVSGRGGRPRFRVVARVWMVECGNPPRRAASPVGPALLAQPLLDQPLQRVAAQPAAARRGRPRRLLAGGSCSSPIACEVMATNLTAFLSASPVVMFPRLVGTHRH